MLRKAMKRIASRSSLLLLAVAMILGCSSSSGDPSDTATSDQVSSDATSTDTAQPDQASGDQISEPDVVDPVVLAPQIPIEKMERDAATVCAEAYKVQAIVAGQNENYAAGGQTRTFFLALPDTAAFPGPRPLFLGLHGTNGTGSQFFESRVLQQFVDRGVIVLAPDGNENGTIWPVWDALRNPDDMETPNPDMDFIDSLIDCVAAYHDIDKNRVYLGGHSAGGIMANYMLQRRSSLYAGGIVGSGMFDLTSPISAEPLEPMAVIVTWGGDNDEWAGQAGDGPSSGVSFPEQAYFGSQFWEGSDGINQVYCKGGDIGHSWLIDINDWMLGFLLYHPKGLGVNDDYVFETPDSADGNVCSEGVPVYVPAVVVECEATANPACDSYCQLIGDCVVENGTASGVFVDELTALGFTGEGMGDCGGCTANCATDVVDGGGTDETVTACIQTTAEATECTGGLEGALSAASVINQCCVGHLDSKVCERLCTEVLLNDVVMSMNLFTSCLQWQTVDPDAGSGDGSSP
jgi:poly(3-hydroxybutyrate) depolymerase